MHGFVSEAVIFQTTAVLIVFQTLWALCKASGCGGSCDCGFDWTGGDTPEADVTLRYEVMSGLIGAFSPLLLTGLGYMGYKYCTRNSTPSVPQSNPFSWRDSLNQPPPYERPRGSTPFSLYGESDDDFLTKGSVSQANGSPGRGGPPESVTNGSKSGVQSRQINIHRSVKSDYTNAWFKNVVKSQY